MTEEEINLQEAESETTEQRILRAAENEFLQKGFAGARTTAIAEAAGVTHAMLHYYYRTKEKLFERVISEKLLAVGKMFQLRIDENRSLADCIRGAVAAHFDFVCENPNLPRFMVCEVFTNQKLIDMLHEKLQQISGLTIGILQAKIDQAAKSGECREVSAKSLIIDIVSLNVFAVLAQPLAVRMGNPYPQTDSADYLAKRKEENVQTILCKLKI